MFIFLFFIPSSAVITIIIVCLKYFGAFLLKIDNGWWCGEKLSHCFVIMRIYKINLLNNWKADDVLSKMLSTQERRARIYRVELKDTQDNCILHKRDVIFHYWWLLITKNAKDNYRYISNSHGCWSLKKEIFICLRWQQSQLDCFVHPLSLLCNKAIINKN